MLDDFLFRAAFAGIGVAIAAAPLGCFVTWRRMVYFGDALAHAAILGVALALSFSISIFAAVLTVSIVMVGVITTLTGRGLTMDSTLGVVAHSALAVGLVVVSQLQGVRVDLMAYLFGDILAVSKGDLLVIWGSAACVGGLIAWRWSALLTATLNPDLAWSEGIDPRRERLILTLALAILVAVAIKVVGALLISSMLIIPAAAARPLATTPERMVVIAGVIGIASALGGLALSFELDSPTGPTIVSVAAALFTGSVVLRTALRRRAD